MRFTPDARLLAAAGLVRQDAVFADIGTDHAFLPLFLLEEGKIKSAVAADINEGPLENARRTILSSPYADRVTFLLTDGLRGVENRGVTDIAVCGMGGELIASILDAAPFVKDEKIALILGPMTKQETLFSYLAKEGFAVDRAVYSSAEGKYYVTISAHYTGEPYELSAADAVLGPAGCRDLSDENYRGYLERKQRAYLRAYQGKRAGGEAAEGEAQILSAMKTLGKEEKTV